MKVQASVVLFLCFMIFHPTYAQVAINKDGSAPDNSAGLDAPKNENDPYGLRYADFVVPMVKAIQEQQAVIEELKSQNADLLRRIEALEKR